MTRKRKQRFIAATIILFGIILLYTFLPITSTEQQLKAICRVKVRGCYEVKVDKEHTLYLSLRADSLQQGSRRASDVEQTAEGSGAFVSNVGDVVTSDSVWQSAKEKLSNKELQQRLLLLDTLQSKRLVTLREEKKELDYYASKHSVADDGYNDVMAYRAQLETRINEADSTQSLVRELLKRPQLTAQLHACAEIKCATDTLRYEATLRSHRHGLLLLQINTKRLPQGCSRFSVFRWGAYSAEPTLLSYNDLGELSVGEMPKAIASKDTLFPSVEGGIYVNASHHLCGVKRGEQRVSAYQVARLLRNVHCWPVWWYLNFKAWWQRWREENELATPQLAKSELQCVKITLADTLSYEGQVAKQADSLHLHGYGKLSTPDGSSWIGLWQNDTLKEGKCLLANGTVYEGCFNTQGQANGFCRQYAANGEYYEGEFVDGKRTGHGFSTQSRRMVRCGEWKNNVFKGERMTYTPQRIYGIDLSRHQHEKGKKKYAINWDALRITSLGTGRRVQGEVNYPVSFVYIKSTEGKSVYNKYYANDVKQARAHGIAVGTYHFFSTTSTASEQAAFFLKMSWIANEDLPPVLDVEPLPSQIKKMGGEKVLFQEMLTWLHLVEQKHGKRPVLYISQQFVNDYLVHAPAELRTYDAWIARYGEYKPYVKLLHWQLTPYGCVTGIQGDVDINVFNGSKEQFESYLKKESSKKHES